MKKQGKLEIRSLPTLLEQRNALLDEMDALVDKANTETRSMSQEEIQKFNEMKGKIEQIDQTLKADQERRALELEKGKDSGSDNQEEKRALEEANFLKFVRGEERALDVANNGGIIPAHIANKIIEKVKELCPIYSMATVYNVGGDLVFPVYDDSADTGAALVEDMQELTESAGKFTTIKLQNHIVGVLKLISKSLMNRSDFDLLSFIVSKVAENIRDFLENACLNGKEDKYTGVFGTKNLVTAASETAITTDELIDVQMTVPQEFQGKSVWIMNKETFQNIRKLKDNDGNYLLNKDLTTSFGWVLLGKPVYVSDNAPKIAAGKTALVYGDMSGLYLKLAQAMEIQVLMEKYATRHAVGVVGYVEFDCNIVEAQKLAGLKMAGVAAASSRAAGGAKK